jgi:hypothetical protein
MALTPKGQSESQFVHQRPRTLLNTEVGANACHTRRTEERHPVPARTKGDSYFRRKPVNAKASFMSPGAFDMVAVRGESVLML